MTRIKRLICALAALAMLMMSYNPALANFKGSLQRNEPWTLKFNDVPTSYAVTVIFVDSMGRQVIDLFTVAPEQSFNGYSQANIPKDTRRIIIELDIPTGGFASIEVHQGTQQFVGDFCSDGVCPDGSATSADPRLVFDVV
jgi:hypothetical protein